MIVCACANCQTSTIPSVILDSLIYETKKGRECGNLAIKQQIEINAITAQLTTQGKIISLKDSHIASLEAIVASQTNELKETGLELYYWVVETQRRIAAKAEMDRKEIQKKYENIVFKSFANDSLRMRELSNLYNSIGNP